MPTVPQGQGARERRPTMRDVAREAGVALRTVSRVVNEEPNVNPELADRVRSAISALGYRLDERARQLRKGQSSTLGAVLRGVGAGWLPTAEAVALDHGLLVLSATTKDDEHSYNQLVASLAQRRFDGLLVEPVGTSTPYLIAEVEAGLPVVAVDRPLTGVDADSVISDNAGGVRSLVSHLADVGHRRIAYVGDSTRIFTGRQRAEAAREGLAGLGTGGLDELILTDPDSRGVVAAALERFGRMPAPPTAVIAGNGDTGVELVRQAGGPASPYAYAIFDEIPMNEFFAEPVTVVAQDLEGMGRTAVELLVARMADASHPPQHVVLPTELRVRASSLRHLPGRRP